MPTIALLNQSGEKIKDITLSDSVFGIEELNQQVIYDVVNCQRAAMRQGTHDVKNRSEVRGGGRKPWRQKGTGRARQGSIRSPQWVHGGVVFAPKPRDFEKKMNAQMRRGAFISALSTMMAEKAIIVVDDMSIEPKTKEAVKVLEALKANRNVTVVTDGVNENALRAFSNLADVEVTTADILNTYDLVSSDYVVITKDAIKKIEEGNK